MQITITNENKRAKSVVISGATGSNASSINGFFDPTSEIHEDRVRYCKRGDSTVWIEHFKTDKGNHRWQIKRASAKGTDSALMWTYGWCALEACRRNEWFVSEDVKMAGVKLHLQTDAEYKVRCPCKLQLFLFVHVRSLLIVVCFCGRLLRLTLLRRPNTPRR